MTVEVRPDRRRRMMATGLFVAFLTLVSGLLDQWVEQRWLWWIVFAVLCYLGLRALGASGPARTPWRAELVPAVASVVVLAAITPFVPAGLGAYAIAAGVVLVIWVVSAWWFGR
jgi:hypothetical protein